MDVVAANRARAVAAVAAAAAAAAVADVVAASNRKVPSKELRRWRLLKQCSDRMKGK